MQQKAFNDNNNNTINHPTPLQQAGHSQQQSEPHQGALLPPHCHRTHSGNSKEQRDQKVGEPAQKAAL
jgi:hypothetical protein